MNPNTSPSKMMTPYYMSQSSPQQAIYVTTPCCDMNNTTIPLSFPSLNYDEPRCNTPESDDHSIISTNTATTANTTISTSINTLTSFSVNDINHVCSTSSNITYAHNHHSEDDEYHIEDDVEEEEDDDDDDLYIPPKQHKKKKKKSKTKTKKKNKNKDQNTNSVRPIADGHCSISWVELCETKLKCHICHNIYSERNTYIECLKKHYNDANNDLVYLECELCLKNPTKQSLERKRRLYRNGVEKMEPHKWRQSKHVANFISHIAGHEGMNPGFYCKVKVWNENKLRYIRCGAQGSTLQNLAKHIYNMHYKMEDIEDEYCVDPTHGYCDKNMLKKMNKINKMNKKSTGIKRKKSTKDAHVRNRKKRKLNNECLSYAKQKNFLSYLLYAAAPKLSVLADYVTDISYTD